MIKCEICGKEVKNIFGLSIHIMHKHGRGTCKDYYDQYMRKEGEGICYCGKETTWYGIGSGYLKYCSPKCSNSSPEVRSKKKETCIDHYGVDNPSQHPDIHKKKQETMMKNHGVKYSTQSTELLNKIKSTWFEREGVYHYSQTVEGRRKHRIDGIKQVEKRIANGEPLMPNIGDTERNCLNVLQKNVEYDIIRNDPSFRYIVGRFPDGHIPEYRLFIQFDEKHHFLDKECTILKSDDIKCTLQLASLGYIVFRISEKDWIKNEDMIIQQFKDLIYDKSKMSPSSP